MARYGPPPRDPLVRFLAHINFDGGDGCWLWRGARSSTGYAVFNAGPDARAALGHRWFYAALREPIPAGLEIDHLCRVRHCVNPWHLEVVTAQVNQRRGEGVSGKHARQTHCIHGHPLAGANLYIRPASGRPGRGCRTCQARIDRRLRKGGALRISSNSSSC